MQKILAVIFSVLLIAGCQIQPLFYKNTEEEFAIYLTEDNRLFLSEDDILSYEPEYAPSGGGRFTLTKNGVKKMEIFKNPLPMAEGDFYGKEFVAKLGEEELYQGTFNAIFSSFLPKNITINGVETVSQEYNFLFVTPFNQQDEEKINNQKLLDHWQKMNKVAIPAKAPP